MACESPVTVVKTREKCAYLPKIELFVVVAVVVVVASVAIFNREAASIGLSRRYN